MKTKKLVIFGTGEIAELAHFYFENDSDLEVVAFTADDKYIKSNSFLNKPLIPFSLIENKFPPSKFNMHVALSYNKLNSIRKSKYIAAKNKGYNLSSYISSKSFFWNDLHVGDNCFILENQTIQPTVKIGNNVMIWSGNHLGHGSYISDHVYLSSHICISGHTSIGQETFVGVNSTFKDFINVGKRVFIAMDASVTKDVPNDSVILGSKSTYLDSDNILNKKIKKNFFNL